MKIHKNVLSQRTIDSIFTELNSSSQIQRWGSSSFSWDESLLCGVSGVCLQSYVGEIPRKYILEDIASLLPDDNSDTVLQYYCWDKNSGIAMHKDSKWSLGITIYLNEFWLAEYGGIFIWKSDDGLRAYVPEYNSAVINDNDEEHMVSSISPYAPSNRLTLQIWSYNGIKE